MNKQGMLFSTDSLNSCLSKTKQRIYDTSQLLAYSLLFSHLTFIPYAQAGPTGGNVVGGAGSITQSGLSTTINQTTGSMAINWDSYNLSANERVQYIQPDSSSISLNRILSHSGSEIYGRIDANGQVILVNPNGVFFGAGAQINVGGLIASGLDISPTDFMNGDYIFNEVLGTNGTVINSGLINASLGGSGGGNVALIGKQVKNEGVINAHLGAVNMAVGKQAVLTFDNQGLIGVKISKEILQDELGIDPALINSGEINAESGRVLLTASVSRDVFSQAVNTGDIEQASSVLVNTDGSFSLGGGADVINSGSINVSTTSENVKAGDVVIIGENIAHIGVIAADAETGVAGNIELHANDKVELKESALVSARAETAGIGGKVKVLGNKVGLLDSSVVDVSGANGGGEVLIGGDRQGLNKNIRNADFLFMSEKANVVADALITGDGGRIITYANDTARIYGNLFARGGLEGGNGGFIETSGKKGFDILNAPDVSASAGEGGLWLIDPYNIIIQSSGDTLTYIADDTTNSPDTFYTSITSALTSTIDVAVIETALGLGNVEIITDALDGGGEAGDIIFNAILDFDGTTGGTGTKTLTLDAAGSISFVANSEITDATPGGDTLNVNLFAAGSVLLNDDVVIDTQGGNFTVGGVGGNTPTSFTANGTASIDTSGRANTAGGNITITTSGTITANTLTANGGATANNSLGSNGGTIALNAIGAITVNGAIQANGTSGSNNGGGGNNEQYPGGNGGDISVVSSASSVTIGSTISSIGGDADGDAGENVNGGNAGSILLSSQAGLGNITLTGDISSAGGSRFESGAQGSANTITITGNTILASDVTVDTDGFDNGTSGGGITFSGNINDDANVINRTLTIDSGTANTSITGSVGNTAAIQTFTIEEANLVDVDAVKTRDGGIDISATTITLGGNLDTTGEGVTAGALALNGNLVLAADNVIITTDSGTDAAISIMGDINADSSVNSRTLTLDADTEVVTLNNIGNTQAIQGLVVTSASTTNLNGNINTKEGGVNITSTAINLGGNIKTDLNTSSNNAGSVIFSGAVDLINNISIDTDASGTDGNVTFNNTVDADARGNNRTLSITADTGGIDFVSAVGVSEDLQTLTISSAGDVQLKEVRTRSGGIAISANTMTLDGHLLTDDVSAAGSVSLDVGVNTITLDSNVLIGTDASTTDANIAITGNVMATANQSLTLDAGTDGSSNNAIADITIVGNMGAATATGALQNFTITSADVVSIDGVNTTTGGVNITANAVGLGGNINTTFDAGGVAGTVDITAPITLESATSITTDAAITDAAINLNAVNGNNTLTLDAGDAAVTFNADIGSVTAIAGLTVTQAASTTISNNINTGSGGVNITSTAINLAGSIDTTTGGNAGSVSFTGPVTLTGAFDVDTNGSTTDGNVTFVNAVNGATDLTVDAGTATVDFQDAVGNTTALQSLNITNAGILNLNSVFTQTGGINATSSTINLFNNLNTVAVNDAGNISLTGNVLLHNDIVLNTDNVTDGNILITGQVDSSGVARQFTTNSGGGDVTLSSALGSSSALASLDVNSSGTLTLNSVTTAAGAINVAANLINLQGTLDTTNGVIADVATGQINIDGEISLVGATVLNTDAASSTTDGLITVLNRTSGAQNFDVTSGSALVRFLDSVGQDSSDTFIGVNRFTVNNGVANAGIVELNTVVTRDGGIDITGSAITLKGDLHSDNIGTAGAISLNGDVILANDIRIDSGSTASDNNIVVNGNITADSAINNRLLTLSAESQNITVNGSIGSGTNSLGGLVIENATLASIDTVQVQTQGVDITASTIELGGNINTDEAASGVAGEIILNGAVTLAANVTLDSDASITDANITITGPVNADSSANNRFFSAVSGTSAIDIQGDVGTGANGVLGQFVASNTGVINTAAIQTGASGIFMFGDTLNLNGDLSSDGAINAGAIFLQFTNDINLGVDVHLDSNASGVDQDIQIFANNINGNTNALSFDSGTAGVFLNTSVSGVSLFDIQQSGTATLNGVTVSGAGPLNIAADNGIVLTGVYSSDTGQISLNSDADFNQTGQLTLNANASLTTVDNTISLMTHALSNGANVVIDSGANGTVLFNSTDDLSLGNAVSGLNITNNLLNDVVAGDVQIAANDNLFIDGVNTTQTVSLSSLNGDINFSGAASRFSGITATTTNDVLLASNVTSTNAFDITALNIIASGAGGITSINSDIALMGNLTGSNTLNLTAQNGNVDLQTTVLNNLNGLNIDADNVQFSILNPVVTTNDIDLVVRTSNPQYEQTIDLTSTQGQVSITTTNADLVLNASTTVSAQDAVNLTANNGDIRLSTVDVTSGGININATNGAVIDNNGSQNNLNASTIVIRANSGVGSGDAIETSTAELDIINNGAGGGLVEIANTGDVLLTNLVNNGDIDFRNDTNVTIDHVDAGFTVGTYRLDVANGSVLGVDRGSIDFFTVPDITADAAFVTVNGEFGTFERPIVLKLNSEFFLASTISSTFFLGGPPPVVNDTSDLQLSVFDSLNSVSGQQLIEIESIADIDPAIFTELHNYNQKNISIRLPRDQMFEDELENYDRL